MAVGVVAEEAGADRPWAAEGLAEETAAEAAALLQACLLRATPTVPLEAMLPLRVVTMPGLHMELLRVALLLQVRVCTELPSQEEASVARLLLIGRYFRCVFEI